MAFDANETLQQEQAVKLNLIGAQIARFRERVKKEDRKCSPYPV